MRMTASPMQQRKVIILRACWVTFSKCAMHIVFIFNQTYSCGESPEANLGRECMPPIGCTLKRHPLIGDAENTPPPVGEPAALSQTPYSAVSPACMDVVPRDTMHQLKQLKLEPTSTSNSSRFDFKQALSSLVELGTRVPCIVLTWKRNIGCVTQHDGDNLRSV